MLVLNVCRKTKRGLIVADGSSNLVVAKIMTYFCAIFTVLSIVTVANLRAAGVKY